MSTPIGDRADYRFGPLERRGLIAGWRGGQIISVAIGLLVAVGALRARPSPASITLAVVAVVCGLAVASWPVAGRTTEEWLPTVIRWGAARTVSSNRFRPGRYLHGHRRGPGGLSRPPTAPAGALRGLSLLAVEAVPPGHAGSASARLARAHTTPPGPTIGVVRDARARTFTAIVAVRGHNFALLGPEDKERRVGGWSALLASLAREGSALHRIGWFASTIPDDGDNVMSYVTAEAAVPAHHAARRSYETLLAEARISTCRQDVHLAVQVRAGRRAGRAGRSVPGHHDTVACAALVRELRSLCRRLGEIDVEVTGVLRPSDVAALFRRAVEPAPSSVDRSIEDAAVQDAAVQGSARAWSVAGLESRSGEPASSTTHEFPGPMAARAEWDHVRTDATFHATYWIAEWPRIVVGPDFLGPMLLGPVRRTLAVVMEPLSPSVATRQAEQAHTADLADAELRRRGGFLATARRHRERELVVWREAELADGHASFRFSGYVTVTAPTLDQLRDACEATEQAAGQARLELRRLYGDQEQAFLFTQPICRGLS